jgi:outer membrane lipoprotein carrier protein
MPCKPRLRWRPAWLFAIAMIVIARELAGAAGADLTSLVDGLQRHYEDTDSFTAKFTETLTSANGTTRERSGTVAYRKSGRIRWEFVGGQPETIVADGVRLYDYDPGLNQVIEMPLKDAFKSRGAAAFILGVGNLKRDFTARPSPTATIDGLKHLVVTPRDGGDKIDLGVDSKSLNIMTLRVTDALGNTLLVKLSDLQRNQPVDDSLFNFVPPPGADIVTAPPTK